jgi:hypothetical protein
MTNTQAAKVQLKWKLREPPLSCVHLHQELEQNELGYLTGGYHCLTCGEAFDRSHSSKPPAEGLT